MTIDSENQFVVEISIMVGEKTLNDVSEEVGRIAWFLDRRDVLTAFELPPSKFVLPPPDRATVNGVIVQLPENDREITAVGETEIEVDGSPGGFVDPRNLPCAAVVLDACITRWQALEQFNPC